jgi:ribosomal protein L16 Arg81 hydroxylase
MQEDFDLAGLLWPIEPAAFFRDTWEKQPLTVARNDPDYYRGLFGLADVDSVIAFTRPKFPEPGDFKPEGPAVRHFVQGCLAEEESSAVLYPDVAEVHRAFQRGKTLILGAMQQRWPPVAALCRRLEGFFGCPVHTNLYLTPPGSQGFDAHFDTHEVFVLQIEGTKNWRFHGLARELPLAGEWAPLAREGLGPPTLEAVLKPGDLLYMPRGHIHEAFTSDCLALHLTVGIKVFRWLDLLHQALDDLGARDVRFRASLPMGLLTDVQAPAPDARFRELLHALVELARADEAALGLAAGFLSKLPALPGAYFAGEAGQGITLDSVLERAPGVICRVFPTQGGQVSLHFPGGRLDGPPRIASALHFIARTPRFAVRSLPDDLTAAGKVVLARRLVLDRCLTMVPESSPGRSEQDA